jgi:hypothetical protein
MAHPPLNLIEETVAVFNLDQLDWKDIVEVRQVLWSPIDQYLQPWTQRGGWVWSKHCTKPRVHCTIKWTNWRKKFKYPEYKQWTNTFVSSVHSWAYLQVEFNLNDWAITRYSVFIDSDDYYDQALERVKTLLWIDENDDEYIFSLDDETFALPLIDIYHPDMPKIY